MPTDFIDPKTIVINREHRQRQENIEDIEDLIQSITAVGILNPIILRMEEDLPTLVAGERRLKAALNLGLTQIPFRLFNSLNKEEAEVIELEENLKRKELTWRDTVKAVGRLHSIYKEKDPNWKVEQTSMAVSLSKSYLHKILSVYEALNSNRILKAEGIDQAYNILQRYGERKAESIVSDIIAKGASIFESFEFGLDEIKEKEVVVDDFEIISNIKIYDAEEKEENPIDLFDGIDENLEESQNDEKSSNSISENQEKEDIQSLEISNIIRTLPKDPIICANFVEWIKLYEGPKFNLIHCDFPYGNYRGDDSKGSLSNLETEEFYDNTPDVYWALLDALTTNIDRIMSYSAHMLFWFNMNFYTETVLKLRKVGLMVHDHPIIWHKTGGPGGLGVVPGSAVTYPRRTYDTALLCVRGNKPLAQPGMNSYAAPTAGNKIHPSQKSEPMLRFFLKMLVDETTTIFDPTCGSGAALRAAEDLGAKTIFGLELDPNYAQTANNKTLQARVMRQAGTKISEKL